jgi:tRNA 2-thiouridine synthesizing protein A
MNHAAVPTPGPAAAPGSATPDAFTVLDLSGLRCPLPIVRLNTAIKALAPGGALEVRATDPAFELDVQAWCRRTGTALLGIEKTPEGLVARLKKDG